MKEILSTRTRHKKDLERMSQKTGLSISFLIDIALERFLKDPGHLELKK